jgi:hypothetical protein
MATRIYDLSKKEVSDLLRINFFKIGIKAEPTLEELEIFINDVYKNHGNKTEEIFSDAFNELSAGDVEVKEKWCFAPFFTNRLMKAYRVNKFGRQKPSTVPAGLTNEEKWILFFRHLSFYKSMPVNPDWIALFNHCVSKGWIIEVPPINIFSHKAYKLAEKDVKTFVMANWSELITDTNIYKVK